MVRQVFIGGTGRSGTSILREWIGSFDSCSALNFEHRLFIDPNGIIPFFCAHKHLWSPFYMDDALHRLKNHLYLLGGRKPLHNKLLDHIIQTSGIKNIINLSSYSAWDLSLVFPNYFHHVNSLLDSLSEFNYKGSWNGYRSYTIRPSISYVPSQPTPTITSILSGFICNLIGDFLACTSSIYYIDDNTWNLLYSPYLLELIPNAFFINIYRDPRDNICSFLKQRWTPDDLVQASMMYSDLHQQISKNLSLIPPSQRLSIKLEDLVSSPDYYHRLLHNKLDISPTSHSNNIFSSSSFGRWQCELTPDELTTMAPIIKPICDELEYEWL